MSYNAQPLNEDDKRIQRRDIDRDLAILNSDRSKLKRKLDAMVMELRMMRQKEQQLRLDREEREKEIKKMEREAWQLDQEEVRLKKRQGELE